MTEPRIDWGLVMAARLTRVRSAAGPWPDARSKSTPERLSDQQVVDAMARGEFASEFAGRRVLSSMCGRLVVLTMVALAIAIVAEVIGKHAAGLVLRVVGATFLAVMVFTGSVAILLDRRWRQMRTSGVYPRRRATLVVPLALSALTFVFEIVARSAR